LLRFSASTEGSSLRQVGLATSGLSSEPPLVRNGSLDFLLSRGMCIEEGFLSRAFFLGAQYIRLNCFLAGLGRGDLGVRLIDSCSCPINP
jgi:hypothetical protein